MYAFNSLINALLRTVILSFSIIVFNLAQAVVFELCVVLNPFLNFLTCPLRIGSLINNPGIFSSPKSFITSNAASPIPLFSTLQYMLLEVFISSDKYLHTSASTRTCPGIAVKLCCHSPTCSYVGNSITCIAAKSPPVPILGSNPTTYDFFASGFLYQRTCPIRMIGSSPSIAASLIELISVSSNTKNSQPYSRLNFSSPIRPISADFHSSSRSGCSCHSALKL